MFNQYNGSVIAKAVIDYQIAVNVIQWLYQNDLMQLDKDDTIDSLARQFAGKVVIDGLSDRVDFSKYAAVMKVYLLITSDGFYQSFDNVYANHDLAVKRVKELAKRGKEDLEQVSDDFFRSKYGDYTIREEEVLTGESNQALC